MDNPFQRLSSLFLIVICGISFGLSGCESPGAVGTDLTEPESQVVTDTLLIDGVQTLNPNSYSGELSFFSAGQYNDPLFGSMTATGLFRPSLPAESDTMGINTKVLLNIMLDESQVYGDAESAQEFDIYEIGELWRARALMINDDVQINTNALVGSFSVEAGEDSVTTELYRSWVNDYRQYATGAKPDSLYQYEMFGLALVPRNGNKIIPIRTDSTSLIFQNAVTDTFDVGLDQWGYTLERGSNAAFPQGSAPLYSTYESILNFKDLGISDLDVPPPGLSRAELVLYQNNTAMQQGISATERRPQEITIDLHLAEPEYVPENIDPGAPLSQGQTTFFRVQGVYSENDDTYRFNITNMVERIIRAGSPEDREFYVTFPNDGVIKPSLIYTGGDQVPEGFQPKVIITSLKNISN